MSDSERFPDDVRAAVRALTQRAGQDAAFGQQLRADPIGTLTAAGIPPALAQEILNAEPTPDEVQGYRYCDQTCVITCILGPGSWPS